MEVDELTDELEALHGLWWQAQFDATPPEVIDRMVSEALADFEAGLTVPLDEWLESEDDDTDTRPIDAEALNEALRKSK